MTQTVEQLSAAATIEDALVEEIFRAGHSDGWCGNQNRRDVQHVDAGKGWQLYKKSKAALALRNALYAYRTGQLVAVSDDVRAALVRARDTAMHHTLAARIPECGTFGEIAQDLDFALAEMKDTQP